MEFDNDKARYSRSRQERRRQQRRRRLRAVLLSLIVFLAVYLTGCTAVRLSDQAHMQKVYSLKPKPTGTPAPTLSVPPAQTPTPGLSQEEMERIEQERLDAIAAQEESAQRERFAELLETNAEAVGWINVPGTEIDLPILQSDDNEYYLKHDLYRERSKYGVPFADYECDMKESPHLILYGHTMSRTSTKQFSQLKSYQDPEYCRENPVFTLDTMYNSRTYKVVAAYTIPGMPDRSSFFSFNKKEYIDLSTPEVWTEYLAEIQRRSYYTVDGFIEPGERFVSLCTCSKTTGNDRIVVVARPLREGEAPEAADITVNPDPYTPKRGD